MIFGLLLLSGFICWYEGRTLWRARKKKDLFVFLALMVVAVALAVLQMNNVTLPNPLDGINAVLKPVGAWMDGIFS